MPLEPWQRLAMESLPQTMVTHHDDYVKIPHPVRQAQTDATDIWAYVTCVVCHNAWYREHPENPKSRMMKFLDKYWS